MSERRRGAYSAGMATLAIFLAPAVLSPGPLEIANLAGVALAVWMAVDAWRIFGRDDLTATLPYRVAPVSPGILGAGAIVFALSILHGWAAYRHETSSRLLEIEDTLHRIWDFPFSPVSLFARPSLIGPDMSPEAISGVTLCLSAAIAVGLLFGLFALVGRIVEPRSLRRHALLWAGVRAQSAEESLAARGATGLRPMGPRKRDDSIGKPVSGRLALRAVSMLVAVAALPYAPVLYRIFVGIATPEVRLFLDSPFMNNQFFAIWFVGIWALLCASSLILMFAYIRLSLALRLK